MTLALALAVSAGCGGSHNALRHTPHDEALAPLAVIATDEERRALRRLPDEASRDAFIARFWALRDDDPGKPGNTARTRFYRRVAYATDAYREGRAPGWDTDRGRIYLTHGPCSDSTAVLNHPRLVPHVVWTYAGDGRRTADLVVFADRDGYGTFTVLHATVPGERRQVDWQDALRR